MARENPTANSRALESSRMFLHLGISPLHFHPRIGHLVISLKKRRDRRIFHPFQVPRLGSHQYSSGYTVLMKIFYHLSSLFDVKGLFTFEIYPYFISTMSCHVFYSVAFLEWFVLHCNAFLLVTVVHILSTYQGIL